MCLSKDNLKQLLEDQNICESLFDESVDVSSRSTIEMYGYDYNLIHQHGGENKGLEYFTVYEFKDDTGFNQLVKFNGYHHSYIGTEYRDWQFVDAKEKKVVVYE